MLAALLRAGVCVGDELLSSDTGTPQGGVISPLLANIYLNQLEKNWQRSHRWLGQLVRYADDLVIMCRRRSQGQRALKVLEHEMGLLGLQLHPDKTRIVHLDDREGFDFLGFHHRWAKPRDATCGSCPMALDTGDGPCSSTDTRTPPCPDRRARRGGHRQAQPVPCRLGRVLPVATAHDASTSSSRTPRTASRSSSGSNTNEERGSAAGSCMRTRPSSASTNSLAP